MGCPGRQKGPRAPNTLPRAFHSGRLLQPGRCGSAVAMLRKSENLVGSDCSGCSGRQNGPRAPNTSLRAFHSGRLPQLVAMASAVVGSNVPCYSDHRCVIICTARRGEPLAAGNYNGDLPPGLGSSQATQQRPDSVFQRWEQFRCTEGSPFTVLRDGLCGWVATGHAPA